MSGHPFLLVLSAPSGGGKTTIARELLRTRADLGYSVSCTTRAPRVGEQDGVDYHFLSSEAFAARVADGAFAEWAEVHGRRYGTLRSAVQGARQVVMAFPDAVTVFIVPPSVDVLVSRLQGRQSESPEAFQVRLRNARHELRDAERYQYLVENDDLEHAVRRVGEIIESEQLRRERLPALGQKVEAVIARLVDGLERAVPVAT